MEKIKDAVTQVSSGTQASLHEYDPAARAQKVISDLVRPLEQPDQVIINDLVSLIHALASNPDSSIDLQQVVSTAEILIHELVKSIPNPVTK